MRLSDASDARRELRRQILRRPLQDAAALLVVDVVLDPLGGDRGCVAASLPNSSSQIGSTRRRSLPSTPT